jgi:ribosomal protein S18 acetylase RimI-like enzyme
MAVARIRPATEADVPAIVQIYVRAYAQPPWYEMHHPAHAEAYLRWVMQVAGTHCLVSEDDEAGMVAGFILAGPRAYEEFVADWERLADRPPEGWPALPAVLGYLWELAVEPALQRRGHGTALLQAAVERLKAQGLRTIILRSNERAAPAIALYRRAGFRRLAVRERHDPLAGPWILDDAGRTG